MTVSLWIHVAVRRIFYFVWSVWLRMKLLCALEIYIVYRSAKWVCNLMGSIYLPFCRQVNKLAFCFRWRRLYVLSLQIFLVNCWMCLYYILLNSIETMLRHRNRFRLCSFTVSGGVYYGCSLGVSTQHIYVSECLG